MSNAINSEWVMKMNENKEVSQADTGVKVSYPSAELLQNTCYEDYRRVLDSYDKIYERVNVALAFTGVIMLVIISSFDYTIINRFVDSSNLELFSLVVLLICSLTSAVLIIWSVIQLLMLIRSKKLVVFDSIAVRNDELYRETLEVASIWLIDKYTRAIVALRPEIDKKQKSFDSAIIKIIIGLLCYAVVIVIQKGM